MENATRNKIKGIAIYQIAGGILGIILTAWVMYSSGMVIDQNALRMGLLAAGLFVFSILCGRMLFRNPARGLRLSIVNQVLQVIYFSFGTYGFQYVAGLRIGIGVDMVGSWVFKFRVALSSFHFNLDTDIGQKFIGINLVALFLIFWMEQLMEKVKD
ncbi:hypothetical protein [Pontibacter burrus]|uniref:Uncharacterized protein n=1 Tax=Pontibacter burrus TaxID=2704466 RepID=A0A6B3LQJ6_9BACT|nr:hypothetical protein [Pontibacter burrus]NEM99069.1 hypothetical protein [Pontibacter burrus]